MVVLVLLQKKVETAVSEDEECTDNFDCQSPDEISNCDLSKEGNSPIPGGPFSALNTSMLPHEILNRLGHQSDDPNSQPEYRFDEFGFRVEEEDGPEQSSNKLLSIPFSEDPQHR